MTTMIYPPEFKLRSGAGGSLENGLCYMETVALIAGEPITDHPQCACPVLTSFGVALNDNLPEDKRQELLPLAYKMAGTRSAGHQHERLKILGLLACRAARSVVYLNNDPRVIAAIDAAERYWQNPTKKAACAAAHVATHAPAHAARAAARAAADADAAYAYAAADAACTAAARAAADADAIWDDAIKALESAIDAGPNSGLEPAEAKRRVDAALASV